MLNIYNQWIKPVWPDQALHYKGPGNQVEWVSPDSGQCFEWLTGFNGNDINQTEFSMTVTRYSMHTT